MSETTHDQAVAREESAPDLVIITGMSGAGRTEAIHTFEDLGYFCVDNLPARLLPSLLDLAASPEGKSTHRRIAAVCDARNRDFFSSLEEELGKLEEAGIDYRVLFLDAADEKLVARYKSSRRRHPLPEKAGLPGAQRYLRHRL